MRAALLIRVSDDEQVKEGYSITAQQAILNRKCAEWGYEVYDEYIDEGYSAKNMKRPDLQRMLKDIELGKIDVVIFWRLDRFTRRSKDFQYMIEHMEKHKCSFRSATEPYDTTTAIGRFQLELAISLGQLERETTSERVKFVMEERHIKGLRNGGPSPFGFSIVNGDLVEVEEEWELGRRIYKMYRDGFVDFQGKRKAGLRAIAIQLNHEGLYKRGTPWNYNSIRYFLTNPSNCGNLRWDKISGKETITENTHEGMVSQEDYDYAQTLLNRRDKDGKTTTSVHPFSGILKCGRCGYALSGTTVAQTKRYYRCVNRQNYGRCDMPLLQEESVLEAFFSALKTTTVFDKLAKPEATKNPTQDIEKELATIQKHKQKWQNMYLNELISMEQLKKELDVYRVREKQIQEILSQTQQKETPRYSREEMFAQLKQFAKVWNRIDNQVAKKNFLYDVFESITMNTDEIKPTGGRGKRVKCYVEDIQFRV